MTLINLSEKKSVLSLIKKILRKKNLSRSILLTLSGRSSFPLYIIFFFIYLGVIHYYISTRYDHFVPRIINYLQPTAFAFFSIIFLTPLIIKISRHFHLEEHPTDTNKKKNSVYYLGGIAIFLSFLFVSC